MFDNVVGIIEYDEKAPVLVIKMLLEQLTDNTKVNPVEDKAVEMLANKADNKVFIDV